MEQHGNNCENTFIKFQKFFENILCNCRAQSILLKLKIVHTKDHVPLQCQKTSERLKFSGNLLKLF